MLYKFDGFIYTNEFDPAFPGYKKNGKYVPLHNYIYWLHTGLVPEKGKTAIHHIDEDKKNNINTNFCICDKGFHVILHQNIVALKACGNKRYRKCSLCHTYDDPENMLNYNGNHRHRKCVARYNKAYKKKYYMLHPRDYKQEYQDKINRRLSV